MMSPLLEPQVRFGMVEPGDGSRQAMPGNVSENRVMGLSRIGDRHLAVGDVDGGLTPDKMPVDLPGIALFESPKVLGQHAVEGVGDHGHEDVEVDLHRDGGRQGIQVEELDRLGDDILHPPPSGVIAHDPFRRCLEIVGDEEGGLFPAVPPEVDLPDLPDIDLRRKNFFREKRPLVCFSVFHVAV